MKKLFCLVFLFSFPLGAGELSSGLVGQELRASFQNKQHEEKNQTKVLPYKQKIETSRIKKKKVYPRGTIETH